ncbi:ATP-binding protein [Streptomyces tsukubensis]
MTSITRGLPAAAPPSRAFAVAFEPADSRVRHMRRITGAALRLWKLDAVTDEALLVVSELVTNAVRHGTGTIRLRVRRTGDLLRIEVTDQSPRAPQPREAGPLDESGRGMLIVAMLAAEWGVSPDGTTTWCTLTLPAAGLEAGR